MTIYDLIACFKDAKELGHNYVGALIKLPETDTYEVIINGANNFDYKCEFYVKMYDENLNHKNVPGLKIINISSAYDFDELEQILY